jgi:hypothetical protein
VGGEFVFSMRGSIAGAEGAWTEVGRTNLKRRDQIDDETAKTDAELFSRVLDSIVSFCQKLTANSIRENKGH